MQIHFGINYLPLVVRCSSHPGTEYIFYTGNLQEERGKLDRLSVFAVAALLSIKKKLRLGLSMALKDS